MTDNGNMEMFCTCAGGVTSWSKMDPGDWPYSVWGCDECGRVWKVPKDLKSSGASPTFSVTEGSLPPGLTLSADGILSGTPTTAGTYRFRP